jgi:hypothetical protein
MELASKVSPLQQAIFDTGQKVGRLAAQLYQRGILVKEDYLQHEEAVHSTLNAVEKPNVPQIYKAGFIHDGM